MLPGWKLVGWLAAVAIGGAIAAPLVTAAAAEDEPGTLGLALAQLYSDDAPNKRGVLVTRRVEVGSAAEAAGIRVGDLIIGVNGSPVAGRDLNEISRQDFRGPAGGTVRVKVVKLDGDKAVEIALTRRPFPPHRNPETDAFSYTAPGSWRFDPRYPFPLPWAPALVRHGFEDVAFGPDFAESSAPDYHSYLFFWWLDGATPLTATQVRDDMLAYFRGISEDRGKRLHFTPDLSKVTAEYHDDTARASRPFGGKDATPRAFAGTVSLYDRDGKLITLHSEVTTTVCVAADHTAVYFAMSMQPRPAAFWRDLDAVRDSFRCAR